MEPDLTIPGHPEVFAIGDMITIRHRDREPAALPGVAPAAMQQGRYAGRVVRQRLDGRNSGPSRYHDKGNLATIGKPKAVADLPGIELTGFIAWLIWLFVHLFYLIGVQNRLRVHALERELPDKRSQLAHHHHDRRQPTRRSTTAPIRSRLSATRSIDAVRKRRQR